MKETLEFYNSDISQKIRANANKMAGLRDNQSFNEIELVLGFASYIYWLAGMIKLEGTKEQDTYLEEVSETAREVALEFTGLIKNSEHLKKVIQNKIPFNPEQEIEWGWSKVEHNNWKYCLTRAVILITRQLAYATLDYSDEISAEDPPEKLDFLSFVELPDLYQEALLWGSIVLGPEAAGELFHMEL